MLLKVLVLQRIYDLSDDAAEFPINDRLSFRRFLGLELQHPVPDAKCIWHYRGQLRKAEVFDALFDAFVERIEAAGLPLDQGKVVDATMVKAPVQRNSRQGERAHQARQGPARLEPRQGTAEGHRCALGKQARQAPLRLQEPREG